MLIAIKKFQVYSIDSAKSFEVNRRVLTQGTTVSRFFFCLIFIFRWCWSQLKKFQVYSIDSAKSFEVCKIIHEKLVDIVGIRK